MYRFLVVIEKAEGNYSAYSPDLLGCVATGKTIEEVQKNMEGAVRMHLEGMLEDHEPIPTSESMAQYIEISLPDAVA